MTGETKYPMLFCVMCKGDLCVCVIVHMFAAPVQNKDTALRSRGGQKGVEDGEQLSLRCRIEEQEELEINKAINRRDQADMWLSGCHENKLNCTAFPTILCLSFRSQANDFLDM